MGPGELGSLRPQGDPKKAIMSLMSQPNSNASNFPSHSQTSGGKKAYKGPSPL